MKHKPTKASKIRYLLSDCDYGTKELAHMVGCSPQMVRWVRKQVQRPPSRYARMDAQLQTLQAQVDRLTEMVRRMAKQQLG